MSCTIKAHLQRPDSSIEVRRIPVTATNWDSHSGIYTEVAAKVGSAFPGLVNKQFTLKWRDSDGDLVMMSSDEEMTEAFSNAHNSTLKIFITLESVKETEPGELLDMQSDGNQGTAAGENSVSEPQTHDACQAEWPFLRTGFAFGNRLPFGRPEEFCGRVGGARKRGNPDYYNPHGHHFCHLVHHGHHVRSHGRCGDRQEMFGPFGGHAFFEGPPSHPFFNSGKHFGHHRHHHNGKRHHGKDSWKSSLREAVPVAHRRWAKASIRSWRVQNLKNATSTSSDSDQDVYALDNSSVPEAYTEWLEMLMSKWHTSLGQEPADARADKEKNGEDSNNLKASVPLEFRKWTKWYLARHFGKKEAPKFRKNRGCSNFGDKMAKHRKGWKKGYKMHTLNVSIPMIHRMWAKIVIKDWRQEHNVPDPRASSRGTVSSESEDTEKEASRGDMTVPNDYVRWMHNFLARWHLWRGEVKKVGVERGGMAEFKDTVPNHFRKWVKCYLWSRYGNGVRKEVDTACQYQKWLQVFQKKWLQNQGKLDNTDELVLTSSDDEMVARQTNDDEAEKTVESLKKLRLGADDDGTKKNVRFHPSTEPQVKDIGDFEGAVFHKKMTPGFRHWAEEALWQWDGKTTPNSGLADGANSDLIPPHIYKWMSKVMLKMQMKRMKQELKQAKHSMKASKKT